MAGRRISVSPWVCLDAKGNEVDNNNDVLLQIPPEIRFNARHVVVFTLTPEEHHAVFSANSAAASRNPGPSGGAQ